ncbi:MAG: acetylornithine transaminase [Thermodesulfovibrionales bacterium]|nr:acetylornithine transaminase [Thermodesulfovibrionales bacterium]
MLSLQFMETKTLIADSEKYIMSTYNRNPVVLVKGRGTRVYSIDGKEYIDFVGGVAVNILGHCHRRVVIALQKQSQKLIHVSNLYHIEPQIRLAKLLVQNSFADKVFFCNSGAESNEAAIKLARKYAKDKLGADKYEIITAYGSFHGRTIATITATGQEKFQVGFSPLLPGFKYVPFGDADAIEKAITPQTCAILLEPIQGEGGVNVPPSDYFKKVREICDRNKLLLILDEVQTGIGRTGKLFAYEHFDIKPDIMTIAKGLGAGVPIGAMLATQQVADSFVPGSHASTFGGNPLVCSSAIATIETILEDGILLDYCTRIGKYFLMKLEKLKEEFPSSIADVRGLGLLLGMQMNMDCNYIVKECLNRGFLVNAAGNNVIRFAPPVIIEEKEIDMLIENLREIIGRYNEETFSYD